MASLGQKMVWGPELASVALESPPIIPPGHRTIAVFSSTECQNRVNSPTGLPSYCPGIPIVRIGMVSNLKAHFPYQNGGGGVH